MLRESRRLNAGLNLDRLPFPCVQGCATVRSENMAATVSEGIRSIYQAMEVSTNAQVRLSSLRRPCLGRMVYKLEPPSQAIARGPFGLEAVRSWGDRLSNRAAVLPLLFAHERHQPSA
jgi:hypothetical protein